MCCIFFVKEYYRGHCLLRSKKKHKIVPHSQHSQHIPVMTGDRNSWSTRQDIKIACSNFQHTLERGYHFINLVGGFQERYNTPRYGTPNRQSPGNPPSQLWKESLYGLLAKVARGVFQRCVETTLDAWKNNPFEKYESSSKWMNIFPKFQGEHSKNIWVATT